MSIKHTPIGLRVDMEYLNNQSADFLKGAILAATENFCAVVQSQGMKYTLEMINKYRLALKNKGEE